jgi:Tfp pilus assembly protein PilV
MKLLRRKTQTRRAPQGERGFTLIETTIALGVMMVAALGVAALFLHSINFNSGAAGRAMAMAVAQRQVERLRSVSFDSLADDAGTVVSDGHSYDFTVDVTVVDTDDDDGKDTLKRIQVSVTPQTDNGAWAGQSVVIWTERAALGTGANR